MQINYLCYSLYCLSLKKQTKNKAEDFILIFAANFKLQINEGNFTTVIVRIVDVEPFK